MDFLRLFFLVGLLPVAVVAWRVRLAFRSLAQTAQENEGFAMRRASLSPSEWRKWNQEFLRWRFFRVMFWLALGEGLLLALALRQVQALPGLLVFLLIGQLVPFGVVYLLHLLLLFSYGRFNLQRFDPTQETTRQLALLLVVLAAWTPLPVAWLFFRCIA